MTPLLILWEQLKTAGKAENKGHNEYVYYDEACRVEACRDEACNKEACSKYNCREKAHGDDRGSGHDCDDGGSGICGR